MPMNRQRSRPSDYGPRGAGQFDEQVRIQRRSGTVTRHEPQGTYEDFVPGNTVETIAASTRLACVTPIGGNSDEQSQISNLATTTVKKYIVRLRHFPEITTHWRMLWRGIVLNVDATDHQTERRSGSGYSVLTCVFAGNAPVETLGDGSTVGGAPEPNSSGNISTLPID